jgi:hypothetical protein
MKILQIKIIGTQTTFSTNFGGKLSFILSFLFLERLHCWILMNAETLAPMVANWPPKFDGIRFSSHGANTSP